ncbi:hypothetical protein WA026_016138 [Henosepilachna vigintioctopunctata]|uniref:Uncharacterized protein n=1 Tax=Henosepilachna vigintioctopunctata TaxID=420089 RepID=A0AAW1TP66_9CUCU
MEASKSINKLTDQELEYPVAHLSEISEDGLEYDEDWSEEDHEPLNFEDDVPILNENIFDDIVIGDLPVQFEDEIILEIENESNVGTSDKQEVFEQDENLDINNLPIT